VSPECRPHDIGRGRWSEGPEQGLQTKGGEALPAIDIAPEAPVRPLIDSWHVLWTRSNCESLVHDQLAAHGFRLFLPMIESWFRRGVVRRLERIPLFKGYLFLRHAMDKESYLQVCKARGLVRILGERWDRLSIMGESEIETIKRILGTGRTVFPYPYLRQGQRVRIRRGPLSGVEGIIVRVNPKKGLLVVSVDLLQRSVAVHLDCTDLEAA
jgi:transcription termination/antitermination protein NusG